MEEQEKQILKDNARGSRPSGRELNYLIIAFSVSALILGALLLTGKPKVKEVKQVQYVNKTFNTQVEILNACGRRGLTDLATNFLRKNQIDVVQTKNYISFDLEKTLIIDRAGNKEKAESIAAVLGVPASQVISQINKDYLLDVSILLGKDYSHLKFSN